ncbi:MAG: class I SAM-dependent methyltransferase [Planctomycetota bacterium]
MPVTPPHPHWTDEPLDQRNVVELVHDHLRSEPLEGALVIDATAGNGHDTLFLAERVGDSGRVLAIDVQPAAIEATRLRLQAHGVCGRCDLRLGDHKGLAELCPTEWRGRVHAAVFNLGYLPGFLPGGERVVLTEARASVAAASAALGLLAPGGLLVLAIYTGHADGAKEAEALHRWALKQAARDVPRVSIRHIRDRGSGAEGRPEVLIMRRASRTPGPPASPGPAPPERAG